MAAAAAVAAVVEAFVVAPADEELGSATAADMMKQISCWGVGVSGIRDAVQGKSGTRQERSASGQEVTKQQRKVAWVAVGRCLEGDGQTISARRLLPYLELRSFKTIETNEN